MSFFIFHDVIDLKKGESKRLVYKLFKIWQRKAIPRVKTLSVKWKCEKEIVHLAHNYSVTGNLEKFIKS